MKFGLNDSVGHGKTVKSDQQVISSRDDAEFIRRPHLWPNKTNLPLTNKNEKDSEIPTINKLGFLLTSDGGPPFIVYLGMIYHNPKTMQTKQYNSVEELLADGWIVD